MWLQLRIVRYYLKVAMYVSNYIDDHAITTDTTTYYSRPVSNH